MLNNCNNFCLSKAFFFIFLTILAAAIFQNNLLEFSDNNYFSGFQKESEALVLGGIIADDLNLDKKGANLGFVAKEGVFKYPDNVLDAYPIFSGVPGNTKPVFSPYVSQYGIQEVVFSKIHRFFGLGELSQLQIINSIMFAIVVVSLFFLYRQIYDNIFAVIFLITMLGSPWVGSFARNLYWVPFLWFIPALLAAILYIEQRPRVRVFLLFCIAFSVFVKSLAGYEYLSTITLFACSIFVVAPFFKYKEQKPSVHFTLFFLVFAACVVGFMGALLVHAGMRGDSVFSGLQSIYDYDVKRRTYGDPSLFDPVFKASLEISPFSVVKTYVMIWGTPLVIWLPGALFKWLMVFSLGSLWYMFCKNHPSRQRDAVLLAFFFMAPVSWFVLAKGHSYIHTHLNYVLWYFGFVQALVYVAFNTVIIFTLRFVEWLKAADFLRRSRYLVTIVFFAVFVGGYVFTTTNPKHRLSENELTNLLAKSPPNLENVDFSERFELKALSASRTENKTVVRIWWKPLTSFQVNEWFFFIHSIDDKGNIVLNHQIPLHFDEQVSSLGGDILFDQLTFENHPGNSSNRLAVGFYRKNYPLLIANKGDRDWNNSRVIIKLQ